MCSRKSGAGDDGDGKNGAGRKGGVGKSCKASSGMWKRGAEETSRRSPGYNLMQPTSRVHSLLASMKRLCDGNKRWRGRVSPMECPVTSASRQD